MAARGQLHNFVWVQKTENSIVILVKIVQFKMVAMAQLHNFLWPQKLKVRIYSIFTTCITFPMIQLCTGDFSRVLLKIKMTATNRFHNILWAG